MPRGKRSSSTRSTHSGTDDEELRPRPFWSGLLSFGLVSIPVDLYPAHRHSGAGLRMLDADGTPLARRYYCPREEKELSGDELVNGYELDNGKVVVVTDEELESLAPKKSREIDLQLFVDRDSIDPMYFERSYFLAPGADSGKAYRLLGAVMERSRRAGIATFVMRDREYLVAIFCEGGLLRAETLRFAGEVRSVADIGLPKPLEPQTKQVQAVKRAVSALQQSRWDKSELTDTHAAAIRELAEAKAKRKRDVIASASAESGGGAEIIDLMEVLRQSLAESGLSAKKPANSGSRSGGARRKPAQRSTKRKARPSARAGAATKRTRAAARRRSRRKAS